MVTYSTLLVVVPGSGEASCSLLTIFSSASASSDDLKQHAWRIFVAKCRLVTCWVLEGA